MNIKAEKIVGYIMLAIGLIFIFIAVYNVYAVFTGQSAPPEVFKMENIVFNVSGNERVVNSVELVSGKIAGRLMDMSAWYILMFFLAYIGGKISGLGIQLVKEIKVTVKE